MKSLTGKEKSLIGCVHLRPLPGTPLHDSNKWPLSRIFDIAAEEARDVC